jgi:hypothetical protein
LRTVAARLAERAAPLLAVVERAFDDQGWQYERASGLTTVRTVLQHGESHVPVIVTSAERLEQVHAFGLLQTEVPAPARSAVGELLHRINWPLPLGGFEMDVDSGAVRFHVAIDVEGGSLTPDQAAMLVNICVNTVVAFAPRIAAVAHGGVAPRDAMGLSSAKLN